MEGVDETASEPNSPQLPRHAGDQFIGQDNQFFDLDLRIEWRAVGFSLQGEWKIIIGSKGLFSERVECVCAPYIPNPSHPRQYHGRCRQK